MPAMAMIRVTALFIAILCTNPGVASAMARKGESAPPFTVTSTSGQQITLANYRGKVLLMEYFATWCTPCRESTAHLVNLYQTFGKQGIQILGLSLDDDGDKAVREYILANRINYPVALAGEAVQADYAIRSVPTLYVIAKNGLIAEKFMGYNDDIEKRLQQLLLKLLSE